MIERRFLSATEVRSTGLNKLSGYAATFDGVAKLPQFQEKLAPGCFTRAIDQDVVALVEHNPQRLLGRTKSGTLRLKQDSRGLAFEIDLPKTQEAADTQELVKRGDLNSCSFGFHINGDGQKWSEERAADGTHYILRTITDLNLQDISLVAFPAYSNTNVQARSSAVVPAELRSAVDAHNAALSGGYFFSNCRTVQEAQAKADRFAARVNEHRASKAAAVTTRRRNLLNSVL